MNVMIRRARGPGQRRAAFDVQRTHAPYAQKLSPMTPMSSSATHHTCMPALTGCERPTVSVTLPEACDEVGAALLCPPLRSSSSQIGACVPAPPTHPRDQVHFRGRRREARSTPGRRGARRRRAGRRWRRGARAACGGRPGRRRRRRASRGRCRPAASGTLRRRGRRRRGGARGGVCHAKGHAVVGNARDAHRVLVPPSDQEGHAGEEAFPGAREGHRVSRFGVSVPPLAGHLQISAGEGTGRCSCDAPNLCERLLTASRPPRSLQRLGHPSLGLKHDRLDAGGVGGRDGQAAGVPGRGALRHGAHGRGGREDVREDVRCLQGERGGAEEGPRDGVGGDARQARGRGRGPLVRRPLRQALVDEARGGAGSRQWCRRRRREGRLGRSRSPGGGRRGGSLRHDKQGIRLRGWDERRTSATALALIGGGAHLEASTRRGRGARRRARRPPGHQWRLRLAHQRLPLCHLARAPPHRIPQEVLLNALHGHKQLELRGRSVRTGPRRG